jgi:CRP-like cAMP-binding protein
MQFRNVILSAMDAGDMDMLSPDLKEVALFGGESLGEPGSLSQWVYFPSNSAISFVTVMSDGREVETNSVGYSGAAGLLPALTHVAPSSRMLVQIGGGAIALPVDKLRERASQSPTLMKLILRSAQGLTAQAEQSAACYALHQLPARLARWLLICGDRVDRPQMELTQDHMGLMAGALRSSISLVASEFKEMDLIRYSRGHLEIIDRQGLERCACECYAIDCARREAILATAYADSTTVSGRDPVALRVA